MKDEEKFLSSIDLGYFNSGGIKATLMATRSDGAKFYWVRYSPKNDLTKDAGYQSRAESGPAVFDATGNEIYNDQGGLGSYDLKTELSDFKNFEKLYKV
jgi:hypothetical protein